MEEKTNVIRVLDKLKVNYKFHSYINSGAISGVDVAKYLNQDENRVFKTLVTIAKSKKNYVFMIPSHKELDLKKAAKAVGEKAVEMIKQKDLLPLTGYIHGGCSPIGMKKHFLTVIDETAKNFETIIFSAGKIGYQVELNPIKLQEIIGGEFFDITK